MQKRLINFDKGRYDAELLYANLDLASYNKLVVDLTPLLNSLAVKPTKELIAGLLRNPKEFAFDTIIGETPITIANIPVSKQKAIDMVQMPDAWLKVIDIANAFNKNIAENPHHITRPGMDGEKIPRIETDVFDLTKSGFVLNPEYIVQLKEKYCLYTQNDKQNKVLDEVLKIYNAFKELKEMGVIGIPSLQGIGISISQGMNESHVVYNPANAVVWVK